MAEPFRLTGTSPSGKTGTVWACGKCMRTCIDEGHATRCCDPRCPKCGEPAEKGRIRCNDCSAKLRAKKDRERFDRAPKIHIDDYPHEYVVLDFNDYDTHVDEWQEMPDDERPEWAWAIEWVSKCPRPDARDVMEHVLEDWHEDAIGDIDTDALQEAINAWADAQSVRWWRQSSTIVVLAHDEATCEEL